MKLPLNTPQPPLASLAAEPAPSLRPEPIQGMLNGGPQCWHIEDGRCCGRAERWIGHRGYRGSPPTAHAFVTARYTRDYSRLLRENDIWPPRSEAPAP